MASPEYNLSKTSFIKFEQCSKAFFLYRNFPYLKDKLPIDKQLTFRRGHQVGELAKGLFPGGTDVSALAGNSSDALIKTKELIASKCPVIYEAAFVYKGVLIMADILCLNEGNYQAYEIKSSLKVSETYLKDAYLQYFVLKNSLPGFDDLFLVTFDATYVLEESLDLRKLFKKRSVKEKAEQNLAYFEHRIGEAQTLLEKNSIPDIAIGIHCFRPYTCDFFGTCWKDISRKNSIFNLPFTHKQEIFEWYHQGIRTLEELEDEKIGKSHIRLIKKAILENSPLMQKEAIHRFMHRIREPFAAMDMEVWNPAVPQIKGTRPFDQIPFLIGFYTGESSASLFSGHPGDEREVLAKELVEESKKYASIIVYDKTLEFTILSNLGEQFPALLEDLESIKAKVLDLFDLILHHHYYHPEFGNNLSLKSVSSVLLKDHNYGEVQSGLEAMSVYDSYRAEDNPIHKDLLKQKLLDYCLNDCRAVFELVEFFKTL